jgi:hypothetical protein
MCQNAEGNAYLQVCAYRCHGAKLIDNARLAIMPFLQPPDRKP